jgi:hypothetical protein
MIEDGKLDNPRPMNVKVSDEARVGAADVKGRLPVIEPAKNLLQLADVGAARAPIQVPLGRGRFATPISVQDSVAVLDEANGRLLTFDARGTPKSDTRLPAKRQAVRNAG